MYVHQAITHPRGINVFGSALLRAEPDLVDIQMSIVRARSKPPEAFGAANEALNSVLQALRSHGLTDAQIQTSRIGLEMAYSEYPERKFIGYKATIDLRVLVENVDLVESLLSDVVAAGAEAIRKVTYQTSQLKQLRAEARRKSLSSAREKAQVYANAAGVQLGPVIHIEDVNPETVEQRSHAPDIDLTAHDEELEPGQLPGGSIVISAAVMVAFAILPG